MRLRTSSFSVEVLWRKSKHKSMVCVRLSVPLGVLAVIASAVKILTGQPVKIKGRRKPSLCRQTFPIQRTAFLQRALFARIHAPRTEELSIEPSALVCTKVCIGRKEYGAGRIKGSERDCKKTKTRLAIGSESLLYEVQKWSISFLPRGRL